MAHGGADKYYNPNNKVVNDGDVAFADDLNNINYATDASFSLVADDLDILNASVTVAVDGAEAWADSPQGTLPDVLTPGQYSSKAYAQEAREYTTNLVGTLIHKADGTTVLTDSAQVSAGKALTAAGDALSSASAADISEASCLAYKNSAESSKNAAALSETNAASSAVAADASADLAALSAASLPNATTAGPNKLVKSNASGNAFEYPSVTTQGLALIDDATAADQRTTIGLGNVQNVDQTDASNISSGTLADARIASTITRDSELASALALRSRKNVIINGNFDVWQRGISQSLSGYLSDDRWKNVSSGSWCTFSRQSFTLGQTDVPGNPRYYSRSVVTSVAGSGNAVTKSQHIESVSSFAGETITLSFYAKSNSSRNMAVSFTQSPGTGGSPSGGNSPIGSQLVALTTSWAKKTITINIPSISGMVLGSNNNDCLILTFWFDAGSTYSVYSANLGQQSGTFDLSQIQVESGSTATSFEKRTMSEELQLCYRYTEHLRGTARIGDQYYHQRYTVTKRAIPSIIVVSGSFGGADIDVSEYSFRVGSTVAATSTKDFTVLVDAEL